MNDRVLCVDDDARVLAGLQRHLRKQFAVTTAEGGQAGLDLLEGGETFAVVVSDMRMPGMDGVQFLGQVRRLAPDTTRIMLTGNSDQQTAMDAVNEGRIFRFLTKPCPPATMAAALTAGIEQHRLVTAEKELLEKTLRGSIQTLIDVLALVQPEAFGRARRVERLVGELAEAAGIEARWQLEVAAMLSQIGSVTLPGDVAAKLFRGQGLLPDEDKMVRRLPTIEEQLLGHIPRLEIVRELLRCRRCRYDGKANPAGLPSGDDIPWGARALRLAIAFDELAERPGGSAAAAIATLRGRNGEYDPALLALLADVHQEDGQEEIKLLKLAELSPGMHLAEGVESETGTLLVARGLEVTESILVRLTNVAGRVGVKQPIPVRVAAPAAVSRAA